MGNYESREKSRTGGTMMVEFALTIPLLMLLVVGGADFSRLFYHSVTMVNAAGTGSFYGAQSTVFSADFSGMQTAARNDAADVGTISVSPSRTCDCPDKKAVDCFTGQCTGFYGGTGLYGPPRAFVKVTTTQSFEPLIRWPGVSSPVVISQDAYIRVR